MERPPTLIDSPWKRFEVDGLEPRLLDCERVSSEEGEMWTPASFTSESWLALDYYNTALHIKKDYVKV